MKIFNIKPGKKLNTPRNRQFFMDVVLVVVSAFVPHAGIPLGIFAIIKIIVDFYESQGEDEES